MTEISAKSHYENWLYSGIHRRTKRRFTNCRLKTIGCESFFKDTATGANAKRSQLQECFKNLDKGDTLAFYKLDRLGRSPGDIISLLDDLKARGVAFQSVTEAIDTTTPTGRAIWQMLGIMAELERLLIVERTKAGRKAAKIRG